MNSETPKEDMAHLLAVVDGLLRGSRTDIAVLTLLAIRDELNAANARIAALEAELTEEKRKLNEILYDVKYEGGLQHWIAKHDALLMELARRDACDAAKTFTGVGETSRPET